jgi:probable phosphoglycerate mutase
VESARFANPEVVLVRHGETEWSVSGQHTGRTDIPLTDQGRAAAKKLQPVLARIEWSRVLASPLERARMTCELAGLGERMQIDRDLMEWDYGDYEGLTPDAIHLQRPTWMIFRDGCPGGESPEQVGARVDRLIARVRDVPGRVVLFAHGHVFRVFVARWLGLPPSHARLFLLETSTLNVLGYYRDAPALSRWNVPIGDRRLLG